MIAFLKKERELHYAIESWLKLRFGEQARIVQRRVDLHLFLSEHEVRTVLLDAQYSESSGYAIAEDIKRIYQPSPKIVIFSNERAIGRFEKARYAGADVLLPTPFVPSDLEAEL